MYIWYEHSNGHNKNLKWELKRFIFGVNQKRSSCKRNPICKAQKSNNQSFPLLFHKNDSLLHKLTTNLFMIVTNILGTIDEKINKDKQIISLLDDYLANLIDYKYLAYKNEDLVWNDSINKFIPKDWQVYRLGDLFSFIKGKIPSRLSENSDKNCNSVYLTIDAVNSGQELYCSSANMPYCKGHILMVMDGAASGDVYVGFEGVVGSTFCMLESKRHFVSSNFLYQILQRYSSNYKKTNVGSTVPHANKDYILSMQIALPTEID